MSVRRLWLLSVLAFFCISSAAQTIVIKKLEISGENIIVNFDLDDSNPTNNYNVNLYASSDNFSKALINVSGDAGLEVKPGAGKRIVWNVVKEFGPYKGKLALELRGKLYMPFMRIEGTANAKSYRRGKSHEFKWTPGNNNPLSIELFKGGQRLSGDINQANNGSYNLYIPPHAATGKDYRLRIFDMRSPDEVIYTSYFAVKPKIPLLLKVLPVVAVGAIVILIPKKGSTPNDSDDIEDPDFPGGQN